MTNNRTTNMDGLETILKSMEPRLPKSLQLSNSFGYLHKDEVLGLGYVAYLVGKTIVAPRFLNIGAGVGTSGLTMHESCPQAHITTIDISKLSPIGGLENERIAFEQAGFQENIPVQILSDSVKASFDHPELKDLDLVFIDGDHSEKQVNADIQVWWPRVAAGGYLVGHDYDIDHWQAVIDAFDGLTDRTPEAKFVFFADNMIVIQKERKKIE